MLEFASIPLEVPADSNLILGQSHFIKTVEDLYEAMVNTAPGIKFGIAFNEASGHCLTRVDGNDDELKANEDRKVQDGSRQVSQRYADILQAILGEHHAELGEQNDAERSRSVADHHQEI